jgi:urease accessory protein
MHEGSEVGVSGCSGSPGLTPTSPPPTAARKRRTSKRGLYRLLAWLSPGFPIGAFSYSHGLETAAESGAVRDRSSLQAWVTAVVVRGSGRLDADIVRDAHHAAAAGDHLAWIAANERGLAYRATAELALETTAQGEAFLAALRAAWPRRFLDAWAKTGGAVCYPAAVGAAAARARISLADALVGFLQAMAANLVSAGLRLGIIGQTDGQRILAALEPALICAAEEAMTREAADFGAATFAADLASMAHETQYTRLFRS